MTPISPSDYRGLVAPHAIWVTMDDSLEQPKAQVKVPDADREEDDAASSDDDGGLDWSKLPYALRSESP